MRRRSELVDDGESVDSDSDSVEDETVDAESNVVDSADAGTEEAEAQTERSGFQYRSQNRGGKGIRDIRTTKRNGKVVAILAVSADDEVLMVTTGGKIQRLRAGDISVVGRNTQGVRIIRLEGDDKLASMARIPSEIVLETTALEIADEPESTTDAVVADSDAPAADSGDPAADSDASASKPDPEAETDGEDV